MRVLFTDLSRTATISSLNETASYPASNIADVFLDTLYISVLMSDTIMLLFDSDESVDSLFIAGCNATELDIVIKDVSDATIYSATVAIGRELETHYFTQVDGARKILISGDVTGYATNMKIKGFGCGVSERFVDVNNQISPSVLNETSFTRSRTGQVLRNDTPSFRGFDLTLPAMSTADYKALSVKLKALGTHWPTYWDIAEDTDDFEDPMYVEMNEVWRPVRNGRDWVVTIPVLECR